MLGLFSVSMWGMVHCLGFIVCSLQFLVALNVRFYEMSHVFHAGLDDAKNTARICARMVSDGCLLKITKSIHEKVSMW